MDKGYIKQFVIGFTISLAFSAAGMAYGWSAPVMVHLLSNESDIPMTEEQGAWVYTSVEIGDIFTPIPSGILADMYGRKPVIMSIIPMYIISWSLLIATRSYSILILSRIIFGMAMGVIYSVYPIYLGEIVEAKIRGKISAWCSVMWFSGMLFSYSIGPYVSYDTLSCISLTLPILLATALVFIPESPYNLLSRNKFSLAKKTLTKLRCRDSLFIENEIKSIKAAIQQESEKKMPLKELLNETSCRTSLFIFLIISVTGLLGGITVMYSYATEIFSSTKSNIFDPDQSTIILGFIYLLLSIVATLTVDHFGRRPLMLISAGGCGLCHFISGLYFFLQNETEINVSDFNWILLLAVSGNCVFFSFGLGPITPIYQGEIFPNGIKGIASGVFTTMMCSMSVLALRTFQIINSSLGIYSSFWLFSFVNISGCILMFHYLIETNGKTLSEIQEELRNLSNKSKIKPISKETVPFTIET